MQIFMFSNKELDGTEFQNQLKFVIVMGLCCYDYTTRQKYLDVIGLFVPECDFR